MLLRLSATAQIPARLQIASTNGNVTVSYASNLTAALYGFARFEATTNLSPPIVWSNSGWSGGFVLFNSPATNSQEFFRFVQRYPVFQFAIFYNLNMEIAPGNVMTITGPVFCNQSIWEGSSTLTFASIVDAVGTNDTASSDPFATGYATQASGATFSLSGQPVSGSGELYLYNNPTNAEAMLNLPPPAYALGNAAAYSANGQAYLANAADIYITNSPSGTNSSSPKGTNTFVYFQDSALTLIPPDYYLLKKPWTNGVIGTFTNYVSTSLTAGIDCVTNVQYANYSFITNVLFYDWREGWNGGSGPAKAVQAVQIDVGRFNKWLTNNATNGGSSWSATKMLHSGHPIDSIYVYNAVPLTITTLPAVRVTDGQQMPSFSGLTIVTPVPLYVWGNYNIQQTSGGPQSIGTTNTAYTYPAALMADAITVLSSSWNDSTTSKLPPANSTTVNAAMLEGIVQSNGTNYSGGVENFMRLLEDWTSGGGQSLWYNGSIVVMFPSQYATNSWLPAGNYYNAPYRHWAFDLNFQSASGLPPLTPMVVNYVSP